MRNAVLLSILLVLKSLSTFAQKDMKAPIMAANQRFMDMFAKGAANIGDLYTTNGQLLFANSDIVQGTSAINAFWKGAYDAGLKRVKLETVAATQEGSVVIEEGRYVSYGANDTQLDMGKYIVIWKQENGRWKLHRDIGNTSMPASK
ncbi:YybH family protein [Spirosoma gilvum]